MRRLLFLLACLPAIVHGQDEKGIKFQQGLNWEQVREKAKAEDKYIFVDCFATWCGPCKLMDREVYPNEIVGNYMNNKFISVKVQMDISKQDNEEVKNWYADAQALQQAYKVSSFPSYLFFSPEGRIVHRFAGAIRDTDFIKVAGYAVNPERQYYTLLENYRRGDKDYTDMAYLAKNAWSLGDKDVALGVAEDYLHNFLDKQQEDVLCTKENMGFIRQFSNLIGSKDTPFALCYRHPDRVDSIMKDFTDFAGSLVSMVIRKEEIYGKLYRDGKPLTENPDWKGISKAIAEKYGEKYSEMLVLDSQLSFYEGIKNWKEFARFRDLKIIKYPPKPGKGLSSDSRGLNSDAWEVFLHCDNKGILARALVWSELSIKLEMPDTNLQYLDTRANLLYRLGRKEEAIAEEEKVVQWERNAGAIKLYQDALTKMKNGEPTWKEGAPSQPAQSSWKMQPVPIQTRWAKEVSPENALPEYPRPQMVRSEWQNLNGLWEYSITDSTAIHPGNFTGKILVPYPLESALSGAKKSLQPDQELWYRRVLDVKGKGSGKRYLLHFGAVDFRATVYVNGKEAGRHTGGYQEFTFDITDAVHKGSNELLVAVLDPTDKGNNPKGKQSLNPQGIMYTPTSGIWQTVWMEEVPATYIKGLLLTPDVDAGNLSIVVDASNNSDYTIEAEANGQIARGEAGKELRLPVPGARLWSPDDPYLYDLTIRLFYKGRPVDQVKSYFGMRKIEIKKDIAGQERIYLNNRYTFNLGVLDQGFWPDGLYTAPTDSALAWDVATIKAMGFNTIRKHIKIEPARWYYHCDRIGMLVWQDMPYPANLTPGAKAEFESENEANIHQLYNYPSIVCWVLFNEGWNRYDQDRLTDRIKKADPSRIVDGHTGENYDRTAPADLSQKWMNSDMTDIHDYPGPGISPYLSGKARVLGEWGGVRAVTPGHEWDASKGWGYIQSAAADFGKKYEFMIRHLKLFEEEGLSASIYTQPFDVEIEENGLITYDRELFKIPVERIRKINEIMRSNINSDPMRGTTNK